MAEGGFVMPAATDGSLALTQSSRRTPEYSIVRVNYTTIIDHLSSSKEDLTKVARKAFEMNLISNDSRIKYTFSTPSDVCQLAELFMSEMLNLILLKPSNFSKFIECLSEGSTGSLIDLSGVLLSLQSKGGINAPDEEYKISSHNRDAIDDNLTSSITFSFADLAVRVKGKLSTGNIRPGDLRFFLKCCFGCGDNISHISSISEMIETMMEGKYWSYYNYHALEGIIKHFAKDDNELIGRMEDYKTRLTAFKATTKIVDYIEDCTKDELLADDVVGAKMKYDKEFYQKLSFKLKESKYSILKINEKCLSYIDDLWNDISNQFYLPPLPILLAKICGGCIEITWLVPTFIACIINNASQESIAFYQQKNIVRVMINDEVLYYGNEVTDPPAQPITSIGQEQVITSRVTSVQKGLNLQYMKSTATEKNQILLNTNIEKAQEIKDLNLSNTMSNKDISSAFAMKKLRPKPEAYVGDLTFSSTGSSCKRIPEYHIIQEHYATIVSLLSSREVLTRVAREAFDQISIESKNRYTSFAASNTGDHELAVLFVSEMLDAIRESRLSFSGFTKCLYEGLTQPLMELSESLNIMLGEGQSTAVSSEPEATRIPQDRTPNEATLVVQDSHDYTVTPYGSTFSSTGNDLEKEIIPSVDESSLDDYTSKPPPGSGKGLDCCIM